MEANSNQMGITVENKDLKSVILEVCPNGCILDLSGDQNKQVRRSLMQYVTGTKCTLAQSGVTALETKLYEVANITGETPRDREERFIAWLRI